MKKNYFILFFALVLSVSTLFSQTNFKFMAYNALLLTSTNTDRFPYFKKIMDDVQPDILVMEEIENSATMSAFKSNCLSPLYGNGTFIDGPDSDRIIYFKLNLFTFVSHTAIPTVTRDINMFKLRHNESQDILTIFVVHLKAADTQQDRNDRNLEVLEIREITNTFTMDDDFIIAGDFNFYDASEPAYNTLKNINGSVNGYIIDPITMGNNSNWGWSENTPYHTQSPRNGTSFGTPLQGITGGLDDRFDMILFSKSIQNPGGFEYVANSTYAYGNDSQHYNKSINEAPTNSAVGQELADALYYASDHLPIIAEFKYVVVGIDELENKDNVIVYPNPTKSHLYITADSQLDKIFILDISGKIIKELTVYDNEIKINLDELQSGAYFVKVLTQNTEFTSKMIKE